MLYRSIPVVGLPFEEFKHYELSQHRKNFNPKTSKFCSPLQASRLPLSIIIVGIGNEDFEGMHHELYWMESMSPKM